MSSAKKTTKKVAKKVAKTPVAKIKKATVKPVPTADNLFNLEPEPKPPIQSRPQLPQQGSLFDLAEGLSLKKTGMELSAENRRYFLNIARSIAEMIAITRTDYTITMDDVQKVLIQKGYTPAQLGNAAGSVFAGKNWKKVGHGISSRKSNHGRALCLWQWQGLVP